MGLSGNNFSKYGLEKEILLSRNTKYEVFRWEVLPDGKKCPVCRIVEEFY